MQPNFAKLHSVQFILDYLSHQFTLYSALVGKIVKFQDDGSKGGPKDAMGYVAK